MAHYLLCCALPWLTFDPQWSYCWPHGAISMHTSSSHALQELGVENAWVSELIFTSLFVAFVLWTFSPFVFARKRFYTSILYSQILSVLVGQHTNLPSIMRCAMTCAPFSQNQIECVLMSSCL